MQGQESQIRAALDKHWQASASGDVDTEHEIYADDSICEYRRSGDRIVVPATLKAMRCHHPGKASVPPRAGMISGSVMNGPTPIMYIMFSVMALGNPISRSSCGAAGLLPAGARSSSAGGMGSRAIVSPLYQITSRYTGSS